jgi:aminopeptidase-like protein
VTAQEFQPPVAEVESGQVRIEGLDEIESYFDRLWPLLRSLTGAGVRQTHDIISEIVPLDRIEIPSGTKCFDWTVPKEWVVQGAYVIAPDGTRMFDVEENNLHLLNYSVAFEGTLSRQELDEHLHSLPDQPDAIPYVTSYYAPRWGFCVSHRQRQRLPDGEYQVVIRTAHIDGSMTLSEAVLQGDEEAEVLISTNTCHPSLANNELSGPLVAMFLYRRLASLPRRRLTYRFLFLPETIGAIAYLQKHGEHLREKLVAGYVVTCAGDAGPFTYKKSRRGDTLADRAATCVLRELESPGTRVLDFVPYGSDERQYCSAGFNLPVGSLMRSMYMTYPQYHTSEDNRDFISFEALRSTIDVYFRTCLALDVNVTYRNLLPYGEPQLGKRGLLPSYTAGRAYDGDTERRAAPIKWLLNLADGDNDLLAVAERSGLDLQALHSTAQACLAAGLVVRDDHER